jgi:HSP20 family protein
MFALMPWRKRKMALLPRTEIPFRWMPEEFEKLFTRFMTTPVMETPEWEYPWGLIVEEKEKEVVVRAELPGFEPEEVKVELVGELLTVEAEHKEPAEEKAKEEKPEKKVERAYAHVKRVITLPPELELEKTEAVYRNGVLEVHVPRKPEAVGRRIEVKT